MNKRIVLTFDNGPHEQGTPELLEVLRKRSLRATFFLVGSSLATPHGRELAVRVQSEGHRIGNHTMTHGAPLGRRPGRETAEREIGAMQGLLSGLTNEKLFRPNGEKGQLGRHLLSQEAVDYLQEHRFTVVTWNCVPQDWVAPVGSWVTRARETMRSQTWTTIVLHDHRLAGAMQHLEAFLDDLIAQGYEFTNEFPEDSVLLHCGTPTPVLEACFTPTV